MLLAAIMLLAAQPASAAVANPLAPAMAGKLACVQPDRDKKTCRSMASYTRVKGALYTGVARMILSPDSPITIEYSATAEVKGDAVCGTVKPENITAGKLRIGDQLLTDAQAAAVIAKLVEAMGPVLSKEICSIYEPSDGGLVEKASVDGVYQPGGDRPVAWVSPADGYRVAP